MTNGPLTHRGVDSFYFYVFKITVNDMIDFKVTQLGLIGFNNVGEIIPWY